jgi:hypothetical protein
MKPLSRALGLGALVWLVPFVVGVIAYPIHESSRSLFESVMAVTVAAVTVWAGLRYLRPLPSVTTRDGIVVGVAWWAICIVIDLPLFLVGPMQRSLTEYMADIGLTYVMIPFITVGLALATRRGRD